MEKAEPKVFVPVKPVNPRAKLEELRLARIAAHLLIMAQQDGHWKIID